MSALNTYGLTPKAGAWKLFEIDGWPLLVQADSNDDGDGWGLRYSTSVGGDTCAEVVSVWLGSATANEKLEQAFDNTFAEIDEAGARKGLQMLLDQVGPLLGGAA